jgi:hypothetical protein
VGRFVESLCPVAGCQTGQQSTECVAAPPHIAERCAGVPHCRTDGGARAAYVDELDNFSSDWNHLNVRGSEQAAEIAWPAVAALLELP